MVAWKDRYLSETKDAYDIALLFINYLNINIERAVEEHYDLYETEDFDSVVAGARLLARDVRLLMRENDKTLKYLIDILSNEIELDEESRLINQLMESNTNLTYETVLPCLESILKEWKS